MTWYFGCPASAVVPSVRSPLSGSATVTEKVIVALAPTRRSPVQVIAAAVADTAPVVGGVAVVGGVVQHPAQRGR